MSEACATALHPNALRIEQAALVVIDMQEAFRPVISDYESVSKRIAAMVHGSKLLNVPIVVTEQIPEKLGRTAPNILEALPANTKIVEKTAFSCCGAAGFLDQLKNTQARQILVCGLETHVCVNQTVHDLLAAGYQVHLLTDCVTSRAEANRQLGITKMLASGAIASGLEMALFELMRDSTHEQFRAISKLIK